MNAIHVGWALGLLFLALTGRPIEWWVGIAGMYSLAAALSDVVGMLQPSDER